MQSQTIEGTGITFHQVNDEEVAAQAHVNAVNVPVIQGVVTEAPDYSPFDPPESPVED